MNSKVIDNKKVFIIDDVISEYGQQNIIKRTDNSYFRRNHSSNATDKYKFSQSPFDNDVIKDTEIYIKSKELVENLFESEVFLRIAYINSIVFGDVTKIHVDTDDDDITVIYYINDEWDREWGGETIFYEQGEPVLAVLPKAGRAIISDARIEHIGRSPTRLFYGTRYTLAIKFGRLKNEVLL